MYYESILTEDSPYKLWVGNLGCAGEHRHADFEIVYCLKGSFVSRIDNELYEVNPGDIVLIPPMSSHDPTVKKSRDLRALCTIFGSAFLKKYYSGGLNISFERVVYSLNREDSEHRKLIELLDETVELCNEHNAFATLLKTGNLYKIIGFVFSSLAKVEEETESKRSDRRKVANVEKALQLIYSDYMNRITVEQAAEAAGYSKSNFCKIFKEVTGKSFHHLLNLHRVRCSYPMLTQTQIRIEDIAEEVGFSEAKTYCRVFKEITKKTPVEYRKHSGGL